MWSRFTAHGLYNLVTDFSWDTYGPYVTPQLPKDHTLLIRHFFQPGAGRASGDHLAILGERNIYLRTLQRGWIGELLALVVTRSSSHGNPMTGLKQYAVVGDGRSLLETEADALIQELEKRLKRFTEKSKKEWRRN